MNQKKIETRDVVVAEWRSDDGEVCRGEIVKRTKVSAMVKWEAGRTEKCWFGDPAIRFMTADEI